MTGESVTLETFKMAKESSEWGWREKRNVGALKDTFSCALHRWTLLMALVGLLFLVGCTPVSGSHITTTEGTISSPSPSLTTTEIDSTSTSTREQVVLSAETLATATQTVNRSSLGHQKDPEILYSSLGPDSFDEQTQRLPPTQRLARSINSKVSSSQTVETSSLTKDKVPIDDLLESSSAKKNVEIREFESNVIDGSSGEYYHHIQPTKSTGTSVTEMIEKTAAMVQDMHTQLPGEGNGAPRGRALPLTGPGNLTDSAEDPATSTATEEVAVEAKTPVLPSFRSNYDERKTNPDIQDIITGIVKLLNGNVKVQANPNLPPGGGGPAGAGRPLRPLSTRINNRGPPRITDVPPLPLDFDSPSPTLVHRHPPAPPPPPPPPSSSTRIPPPYPFDRPPAIVPLPPQPPEVSAAEHPFLTGVPLPEQVVPPVTESKRPIPIAPPGKRPYRPRPRPRPPGHPLPPMINRRPAIPSQVMGPPPDEPPLQFNENTESEENIGDSYVPSEPLELTPPEEEPHHPSTVNIPEEQPSRETESEEPIHITTESTTLLHMESLTPPKISPAQEFSTMKEEIMDEIPTESMFVMDEEQHVPLESNSEESHTLASESQPSSSVSENPPKIIATSSSSTVTEATKEVLPVDLPILEPSVIGVGVATPVLESSMQEILMQGQASSSGDSVTATTSLPIETLSSLSSSSSTTRSSIGTSTSTSSSSSSTSSSNIINTNIGSSSSASNSNTNTKTHSSGGFPYYPYRPRPGIVLDDTEYKPGVHPIITAPPNPAGGGHGHTGEVFDVTVSAIQGPGGASTGQPFIYPVEIEGVHLPGAGGGEVAVITKAQEGQHFVSIDGKRTYINLFGSATSESKKIVPTRTQQQPTLGTGYAVPEKEPSSSSVAAHPSHPSGSPSASPPRRPYNRRPYHPPVRIDTCIVGDDSTCDSAQNEMCRTEAGVSSCHCRPGYSRRKHREPCRRVVSIMMSLRVDKLYDKRVVWDGKLQDPESEEYKTLEWESSRAIDSAMSMTPFSDDFMGVRVNGLYTNPGGSEPGGAKRGAVFVNLTLQLEESVETLRPAVRHDIQRHLLGVIHRRNNNVGHSALWVDSPPGSVSHLQDVDECSNRELHDCHQDAHCSNVFGSFRCSCPEGFRDPWAGNPHRSGRQCETCSQDHCSGRGECRYENGQPVCHCSGNFYGSQCEVDGEVLGVAVGASVAAVVIIVLTLVCLCMWSRRWAKEHKTATGIGSPVFGYLGAAGSTVKTPAVGSPPYQVSLEDRLRWAQIADVMVQANHYAPEPVSGPTRPSSAMFGYPTLSLTGTLPQGAPPVPLPRLGLSNMSHTGAMSVHGGPTLSVHGALSTHGAMSSHGLRTPDRTVDSTSSEEEDRADLLGRNFHVPRPKSRSSIANQSGIYYDVDFEQADFPKQGAIPLSTYTMSSRAPYYRQ